MKSSSSIFIVIIALSVGGCTSLSNMLRVNNTAVEEQLQTKLALIDNHLLLMQQISTGDYQEQVSLFEKVQADYQQRNSAHHQLRHALVLATTGHPNNDPSLGYTELEDLLQDPGELSDVEINLARVVLNELENIIILEARNAELSSAVSESQFRSDKSGRSNQQSLSQAQRSLREAQLEIDELRTALEEAQAKLDKIKAIEVSSE